MPIITSTINPHWNSLITSIENSFGVEDVIFQNHNASYHRAKGIKSSFFPIDFTPSKAITTEVDLQVVKVNEKMDIGDDWGCERKGTDINKTADGDWGCI